MGGRKVSAKGNAVDVKNLSNIWDPVPRESEHPCHHMVTDYLVTLTYRDRTKIGKVILKPIEIAERIKNKQQKRFLKRIPISDHRH